MMTLRNGNTKAIVTLAVGDEFLTFFKEYCFDTWKAYALKFDYDIIVFTEPIDESERAKRRSASWQKCLVFRNEDIQNYERVVWIDADVVINPLMAECIVSKVPENKIGGIDAYSFFSHQLHDYLYDEYIKMCDAGNKRLVINRTGADYYRNFGIDTDLSNVIQCGVLVITPSLHSEIFEKAYEYEAKYDAELGYHYNYEMRPLSYEIVKHDLHYFIDQRFNMIISNFLYLNAPYLFTENDSVQNDLLKKLAVQTAYVHSFFLHFAGDIYGKTYIKQVNTSIQQPRDVMQLLQEI